MNKDEEELKKKIKENNGDLRRGAPFRIGDYPNKITEFTTGSTRDPISNKAHKQQN